LTHTGDLPRIACLFNYRIGATKQRGEVGLKRSMRTFAQWLRVQMRSGGAGIAAAVLGVTAGRISEYRAAWRLGEAALLATDNAQ
jgi:hypothetical protein